MSSSEVVRVSQRIGVTILLIATLISKEESDYVVSNKGVVDTDYDLRMSSMIPTLIPS